MINLLSKNALINNILSCINSSPEGESKPLAFLVGSPISFDYSRNQGVPGIETVTELIREEVSSRMSWAVGDFEDEIRGKTGAELYQNAFGWLLNNSGIDAVNKVVRTAVLKARLNSNNFYLDGDSDDWFLPPGIEGLGQLISLIPDKLVGPVLTTNFDPLLRLSIRKTTLTPVVHILTANGKLEGRLSDEFRTRNLVYLHGYWRESDTFHTFSQLLNPRPKLKESLKKILTKCRLVVIAYSGWDDIFTQALSDLVQDNDAEIDVLWCFYENDATTIANKYKSLIEKTEYAMGRGRFLPFGGIDCHSIFSEIIESYEKKKSEEKTEADPPHGWEFINATYLSNLRPLQEPDDVLHYFDGAVPNWRHALSDRIPRREKVGKAFNDLEKARTSGNCSVNVILGAGGEGKTTVLLQTAADLALKNEWSVLWCSPESDKIEVPRIEKLEPEKTWLLVADDGDLIVQDIKKLMRQLREAGRSNVHFLLAAREPEWKSAGGSSLDANLIPLRILNSDDALKIVRAWSNYGDKGLKSLVSLANNNERAQKLENAVIDEEDFSGEGSFFGALLDVRLGEKGLREHVKIFLERLRGIEIEASRYSLFDALIYAASCHGIGIPGIYYSVLAELLEVSPKDVFTRVVRPLGEEAAGVRSARHIFTRHRKIAEVILEEAENSFNVDLAEIYANLVRQYHQTGQNITFKDYGDDSYGKIIHIGTLLAKALPLKISSIRRREIAIAAANESILCEPRRISMLVDLGNTYFKLGMPEDAIKVFRTNVANLKNKIDYSRDVRGYWHAWGMCENYLNNRDTYIVNAIITAISLSDYLNPSELKDKDVLFGCKGLGICFSHLAKESSSNQLFGRGLRACAFIGREFVLSEADKVKFDEYDGEANGLNIPQIKDNQQAVDWISDVTQSLFGMVENDYFKSEIVSSAVTFSTLYQKIQKSEQIVELTKPTQHVGLVRKLVLKRPQ